MLFEADDTVGGLARTVVSATGSASTSAAIASSPRAREVAALWDELLGTSCCVRPRLSRIYWRGRFIDYPLRAGDVVRKVGPVELARCVGLLRRRAAAPPRQAESFEDWVSARFGRRLFGLFFKSYTEKVWGVARASCAPIGRRSASATSRC